MAILLFSCFILFIVGGFIGFFVGYSVSWDAKLKLNYLRYIFGVTKMDQLGDTKDFYVESSVEPIFGKYWKKSER